WNEVRIQIERIDAPTSLSDRLPAPARPSATTAASAILAPNVNLDHVELEVRAVLHRLEADVRDDIELRRTADKRLIVEAVLDRPERASALRSDLRGMPRAVVRLRAADDVPVSLSGWSAPTLVNQQVARPARLATWLARTFPTVAAQREYGSTALLDARNIK